MSQENTKTLEVYEKYADVYLEGDIKKERENPEKALQKRKNLEKFLLTSLEGLPKYAKVLEIGAGDGKNASFLRSQNFSVTASDVSAKFRDHLAKEGFTPLKFNVLEDDLDKNYNAVLAWRVFVHFTKGDFKLACDKIYKLLIPGGRFIFNILNKADKNNEDSAWVDYDGAYHMGVERFFQYYSREEVIDFVEKAGFAILSFKTEGGERNKRWFVVAAEKPLGVSEPLQKYVEENILPCYGEIAGHTADHIYQVITRSLNFIDKLADPTLSKDAAYVAAAYHDLGRTIDDDTHEKISAQILLEDEKMKEFFSPVELTTIAEAIEDHRASSKHEPRSIYGKIVSSADRNTIPEVMIDRCFYFIHAKNNRTVEQDAEETRLILRKKYGGTDGYAAKKIYFPDPDFAECLAKIEEITRTPEVFLAEVNRLGLS